MICKKAPIHLRAVNSYIPYSLYCFRKFYAYVQLEAISCLASLVDIVQVGSETVLREYAERIAKVFERPLPPPAEPSSSADWTERAEAAAQGR